MARVRGVRGAAGVCALAAILYLLARSVLTLLVSGIMGLLQPGASLAHAAGFGEVCVVLLQTLVGIGALALPLWWLLCTTRLQAKDMRIMIPTAWSPGFCLPVFLGLANFGNLLGGLLCRVFGIEQPGTLLAAGGMELFVQFLSLCLVPAVTEELFFRGALQGLLRPSGSAAAIFGTALLFGLLHLDLAQGLTAFICAVFLGWLAERSGSILPGMLLHFINNMLAFLTLYLRLYAPAAAAMAIELFILLFFPVFAAWLIRHAHRQGFRFSAGLRPGVDALNVFTSPAYSATVLFLVVYAALV